MKLENYRLLFAAASLVSILAVASPALSAVVSFPNGGEPLSELWLLGPNHLAENYPFNVNASKEYRISVGVTNRMLRSEYYIVYVKFRNQTQPLPDILSSRPSPLPPLYEFQFFLEDGEVWETPLTFTIQFNSTSKVVDYVSINNTIFPVNNPSIWDSEHNGFYYQLFFELWRYDSTSRSFRYHERFVGIWLNMTF